MYDYNFFLGWLLAQTKRHDWMSPRVPQPTLSISRCICEIRPETDDWLEPDRLDFLQQHERNTQESFIFLDSADSAREMNTRWYGGLFRPVTPALRPHVAERLDAELHRASALSNAGNPHFRHTPLEAQTVTEKKRLAGYEVMGSAGCSYLCGHLDATLFRLFNGRLNAEGLITDGNLAERLATHINENALGEPGFYFACALYVEE